MGGEQSALSLAKRDVDFFGIPFLLRFVEIIRIKVVIKEYKPKTKEILPC